MPAQRTGRGTHLDALCCCVPGSAGLQEADEDGSGELDPDEFYEKLGPYLGQKLSPAAVSQLFMRIDADCGGTIDWQVCTVQGSRRWTD